MRRRRPVERGVPTAVGCPASEPFPRAEIASFVMSCLAQMGSITHMGVLPRHHLNVAHLQVLVDRGILASIEQLAV